MASRKATRTDSPVAAREELDAGQTDAAQVQQERLEEQASDQEQLQKEQLQAGTRLGGADRSGLSIPEQRSGVGVRPFNGRVDNMTKRSDADVLEGHFAVLDYENFGKEIREALKVSGVAAEGGVGDADYGVYLEPSDLDPETGYPATARVQLRDEHAAVIVVPYEALRPAPQGGRR